MVRDHEVPELVALPSANPCIAVPDQARLDKPPLAKGDADTLKARGHAVMDSDLLNLVAVPSGDAYGTPVGDDPFDRHMVARGDAGSEPPDDPRPPQEAVVPQYDPAGVGVDA